MENQNTSLIQFFKSAPALIKARLVVIGLLAISVVATSGVVIGEIWKAQAKFRSFVPHQEPKRAVASTEPFSISYELRNVSLSLTDRNNRRSGYAQFTLVFDLPSPEARRWCELNRAQMIHTLLEEGAKFHLEDFDSPRGYELLKRSLTEAFENRFKEHAPRAILIKDFTTH